MARGFKTGGRVAGTPNKANSDLLTRVEEEAGGPLPVLLARIGREALQAKDYATAANALSKAAVFIYPRLQSISPAQPPAFPVLYVEDGMARIPEDWPGPAVRVNRPPRE